MSDVNRQWQGTTDGLPWMHRSLICMLRYLPLWLFYGVVDIVVMFYLVFSGKSRKAAYHYFTRCYGKSGVKVLWSVYLLFRQFGQIIVDRFAFYAGRRFRFDIEGGEYVTEALERGKGCIFLSAHIGNYELAGYAFRTTVPMYVLMYGGEKGTIMENRKKCFEANGIYIITPDADWHYLNKINEILYKGQIFTLFADRIFGSQKTLPVTVLHQDAALPKGPFALAAMYEDAAVLSVFAMKKSYHRYHVYVRPVNAVTPIDYAQQFAVHLTERIEQYPYQWFNIYEFWQERSHT